MFQSYEKYSASRKVLEELEQDNPVRSLRLFDIRIRLAIDVQIDFKGEVSLTKTPDVKQTYIVLLKLMELWNAYEALSRFIPDVSNHVARGTAKSRIYSQSFLADAGCLESLAQAAIAIRQKYETSGTYKKDFDIYSDRLAQDPYLGITLKADAESMLSFVKGERSISGIEILSLIYAERNMYLHNGETVKMGMRYGNRRDLLIGYKDTLLDVVLELADHVIREQIEKSV
jgi:hypothetical protein